jgi:hypothetical protein
LHVQDLQRLADKAIWRKRVVPLVAVAASWAALGIAGCGGGGGGGSTPDPETSRASLTIRWPARSRAITAPSSALSAVVRIAGAGLTSGDVTFTLNRDSIRTDSYTQDYSSPTEARTGQFTVTITFYGQLNGQGGVVGTVSKVVTLTSGTNDLGDIAVNGTVASVTVAPAIALLAASKAVKTRSAFFTVTDGQEFLSIASGQLKAGANSGVAMVTVTVDGKTSEAQKIGVGTAASSLTVSGARGTVPLAGAVTDLIGGVTSNRAAIQSGQSIPVTSSWFYSNAVSAPAGYGDRKFDHWASGNVSVSNAPTYNYVPADAASSLSLTAVYTTRPYPTGGFTPNYSHTEFLHWAQFPLKVYFANSEYAERMKTGLDKWVAATGGVISYEVVTDLALADITFTLGTPPSGLKGITTAEFDPDSRELLHADVVILQSAPSETYPTPVDLLALYTAHEFGHALGMFASTEAGAGHSTDPKDTMYPTTNPSDPFITEQDINTLENIYPNLFNGGTRAVGRRTVKSGKTATITVRCP